MVRGIKQIEVVVDNKIPMGTSTESTLGLPSSAIKLDSITKILLTLLRDESIEIMGIIKKLCHIEKCSHDTGVSYYDNRAAYYDVGYSLDNDLEQRGQVISVILVGIITLVIILIMAWKIRTVILFKPNNESNALILEESDLDESYLSDHILYENLQEELELVAEGSSGKVFKVKFLGLECAMKVFYSYARMDFRRESITLLNLSHPHVVKLFCCFRKSFIIMELMDENLDSFITKIRKRLINYDMPLEVALDVMLQIAEGMLYLHNQGIAHQDLKSLNILLKLRGEFDAPDFQIIAKVADFGNARRFNRRYPTGFVLVPNMNIGTRLWRAPELFQPWGSFLTRFLGLSPRVLPKPLDIYAFAVICSELLTKQIPFSNGNDLSIDVLASKLREGHRPALPSTGCPEELLTLIKDCWHQDPILRPEFHEVCVRLMEVKSSWMSHGQSSES
jgi:hypothetical protein